MLTSVPRAACANDSAPKRSLQILLVEDEPTLGQVTAQALQHRGHSVILASTSAKAFKHLTRQPFDVILLDLQIGEERGEDLVTRLRDSGYWVPPVIIVSARSTVLIHCAVEETKAAAYVQKPCAVDEIQTVLNRVVA